MNFIKIEFSQDRVFGLDILRAIAILFVVYAHGTYIFSDYMTQQIMSIPVLDGVSIFFVLSGFLIGGILINIVETKPMNLSTLVEFWKRRWFRTIPNYLLILICTWMVFGSEGFTEFIKYLLFLQNFNTPHPSFFPEAWSLSIEEWFYLLMPIGIFFTLKVGVKHQQAILFLIVFIILISLSIRYYKFDTYEVETVRDWDLLFRKQVISRMDSIMFGVLGAYLNYYHGSLWMRHKKRCLIFGIALLSLHKFLFLVRVPLNYELNVYYCVYSFSVSSIGTLLLLPFLSNYKRGSGKLYKIITIISLISYSMYLINLSLVQRFLLPNFINLIPVPISGLLLEIYTYIVYWCITIFVSIIIYKYYEKPFTKLRDASFLTYRHSNAK